jgi:3'-phosphoadenosine 5'-phosphosulfate (PAPS) 3'-phosphatase
MEWDTAAAQAVVEAAGGGVYAFDPRVPASAYLEGRPADHGLQPLRYNKEDLHNPFFVVC